MVNISKFINIVERLSGTSGSVTLGKEALREASGKAGQKGEAIFDFMTQKMSEPAVDIAFKGSKNGYTIARATIRDGQQVIGKGTVSVTGLGTEQSVVKYRLNVGENGKVFQESGWIDSSKKMTIDDIAISTKRKNGITTKTIEMGDSMALRAQLNENELAQAADKVIGMPIATKGLAEGNKTLQGLADTIQGKLKDLLAGQEVSLVNNKTINMLKEKLYAMKGTHNAPRWKKTEKVPQEHIDKLMKQGVYDIKPSALKEGLNKDFIKVPSGKEVPVQEYKNAVQQLIDSSGKVNEQYAESLVKEAKMLVEYGEKQGIQFENRDILDAVFKLFKL